MWAGRCAAELGPAPSGCHRWPARVEQNLEQQAVEECEHQPGRVLAGLVGPQFQDSGDIRARTVEACGEQVSYPGLVLCPREGAHEVLGQSGVASTAGLDHRGGTPESRRGRQ
jgi:hypothetical protein